MKNKGNMKLFVGIIVGALISAVGVYAAVTASSITYSNTNSGLTKDNGTPVTNVQEAIDALGKKADRKINVEWATGKTYMGIMYLDPTQPTNICNEQNTLSYNGLKTGCMKWYIYKEDGNNYKAILDHNTTPLVFWSSNNSNVEYASSNIKTLIDDLNSTWEYDATIISGLEIAELTQNNSWKYDDGDTYYYFDSNTTSQSVTTKGESSFAWLYDYTYNCENNGCNVMDNNQYANLSDGNNYYNYGYWTSTPVGNPGSGTLMWRVGAAGGMFDYYGGSQPVNYGLRPVIIVPKSAVN